MPRAMADADEDVNVQVAEASGDPLAEFHLETARKIWPDGSTLHCQVCGHGKPVSLTEIARHLADGWPTCHGMTMAIGDADAPDAEIEIRIEVDY